MTLYSKTLFALISGKAGVGKTTTKNLLSDLVKADGFQVYADSFAKGVKDTAYGMSWDGQKDSKGRRLLQEIGQAGRKYNQDLWVGQMFHRYVMSEYGLFPADIVLVDDWRFPNELEYINRQAKNTGMLEPITIRIEAPKREILKGTAEYIEASENSLPVMVTEMLKYNPNGSYCYTIFNIGSMDDLQDKVKILYENIKSLREIIKND